MDPNANLREQEAILQRNRIVIGDDYERLQELRHALRIWLARGGYEPQWSDYPKASRHYGKSR